MKINELKKKLKAGGCYLAESKKRHDWWYSPLTGKHFPLPRHGSQEIPQGTLKNISELSGVNF